MRKDVLYCEACGETTEHQIDGSDEDGELALCLSCGRLSSLTQPPLDSATVTAMREG